VPGSMMTFRPSDTVVAGVVAGYLGSILVATIR
jgi:hypothetical protein